MPDPTDIIRANREIARLRAALMTILLSLAITLDEREVPEADRPAAGPEGS